MTLTKEDTKVQKLILNVGTEENIQAAISAGEIGQNELSIITNKSDCKRNVGEIIEAALPLTDAGLHLLDGSLILGGGIYDEFVQYIAGLVSTYPACFTTEAAWQQSVTNYGVCGKFVYNSVNNTVRLPKITGIVEGTTDLSALGDLVEAGCPNITGKTTLNVAQFTTSGISGGSGAIKQTFKTSYNWAGSNRFDGAEIEIDASRSSSIYGNSTTVQPQTIKVLYYIVVAASIKTDVEVDIDNIATDLNGKADVDLSNMNPSASTKETIVGWGIPDYSAAIQVSSNTDYTAPCAGIFTSPTDIYINGVKRFEFFELSGSNTANSMTAIVGKGDICKSTTTSGFIYFYPYKGVNNA